MSTNPPQSISSTTVEFPESSSSSTTVPTTPPIHHYTPMHGSFVLPSHDNSTFMLLQWAYDTRNVPVNEKLHRDAFLAAHTRGNNGGAGAGGR